MISVGPTEPTISAFLKVFGCHIEVIDQNVKLSIFWSIPLAALLIKALSIPSIRTAEKERSVLLT